jgi:tetratricopeptide (TPR) repeat protein
MDYVSGFGEAMILVGILGIIGIMLFLIFGLPLIHKFAEHFSAGLIGSGTGSRIVPQYSTAEARVKAGKYADAIAEFRKVLEKFPDDVLAHVRIADLYVEFLNQPKLAEAELLAARAKEKDALLVANRLADLYQFKMQQPVRAIAILREFQARWPETREAGSAEERIKILQNLPEGQATHETPKKIAFRVTDEETLRRRRGY